MDKHRDYQGSRSQKSSAAASSEVADRRSAARTSFVTEALVIEANSGARLSARSADLVLNGCYVDTLNPFQEGSVVRIRLQHGESKLEAHGRVVYQVPSMGMGIEFSELTPENRLTLDGWLAQANGRNRVTDVPFLQQKPEEFEERREEESRFAQLVHILRRKGVLTNSEVALLLKETIDKL